MTTEAIKQTHPFFRIITIISGSCEYKIYHKDKYKVIKLEPGVFLISPPGGFAAPWKIESDCQMLTVAFWFYLTRFLLSSFSGEFRGTHHWYHSNQPAQKTVTNMLQVMEDVAKKYSSPPLRKSSLLTLLHFAHCELLAPSTSGYGGKAIQTYHLAKAFIIDNFHQPINRELVAENVLVTPQYLSMLFKRFDKMSFNSYLVHVRMSHATELLKNTHLHINQISDLCGFQDVNYFIKSFKKYFNVTPGVYRSQTMITFSG